MVIYVSVQEIKHDTNKTRDNSTDTFKSNVILVVKLVGVRYTGMRERQTISLCLLKEREGVKKSNPKDSDLKPFAICSRRCTSYMVPHKWESFVISYFMARVFLFKDNDPS